MPGPSLDDLWFVGGKRLEKLTGTQNVSLLFVGDPLDPEQRCLTADVRDRGRVRPTATLELPDDAHCVRLLRDPFKAATAEPRRATHRYVTPTSNLLFAADGRRLLARNGPDRLVVYPIPNSPNATPGKPKVYQASGGASILAAGHCGRGYAVVTTTLEPDVLCLERVGPMGGSYATGTFRLPGGVTFSEPEADSPLYPCVSSWDEEENACWHLLLGHHLLRLSGYTATKSLLFAKRIGDEVLACKFFRYASPDWFERTSTGGVFRSMHTDGKIDDQYLSTGLRQIFFGYADASTLVAVEQNEREWLLFYGYEEANQQKLHLHSPLSDSVLGVVAISRTLGDEYSYDPGLIVLNHDRRSIGVVGKNWARTVPRATSEVVQTALADDVPYIAYLTRQGELVVYDLEEERVLYRLETEGATE